MVLLVLLLTCAAAQDVLLERYLVEKDKATRARILAELRMPLEEAESYLRKPALRPPADVRGELVRRKLKANHPLGGEFGYVLWVPRDYVPQKSWRLIISLHGQGGNGDDFIHNWLADVQREGNTFLLCPSAGRGGWGHSMLGYRYILDSLHDVQAAYSIDPDAVFIDGASMGGNGSFQFACMAPDLFAGAAPRSGGPLFRYLPAPPGQERTVTSEGLENLLATPIYWIVGARDPEVPNAWVKIARSQMDALRSDFTFREFPDGGHEWFPQENAAVLAWMASKRRDAYPARVGLDSNDRAFNRNFWLEIVEFKGQEILKRSFLDFDRKTIEERNLYPEHAHVRAEVLKEANEIKVTSSGVREIRIYLHPRMIDLSRPLWLTLNGSKSRIEAKPSLEVLLESARRDRGLLYSASVKVKVP